MDRPDPSPAPEEAVARYLAAEGGDPAALHQLAAVIESAARFVAQTGTRQQRADFVAEAPAFVLADGRPPRVASYQPALGRFGPWVTAVLRNKWRQDRRGDRPVSLLIDLAAPVRPPADTLDTPFEPADLDRLDGWPAVPRVELLCLAGLWWKVPTDRWRRWAAAYWQARPDATPADPLPPADWHPADDPRRRTRPLADLLGSRPNRLAVLWNRQRTRLGQLDYFRDQLPADDRTPLTDL